MTKIYFSRILFLGLLVPVLLHGSFEMEVNGLGWRTGKRFERLLDTIIRDPEEPDARLDVSRVEDAILILLSELNRLGYLSAKIEYRLFSADNQLGKGEWNPRGDLEALSWKEGDRVVFLVHHGERAFYQSVNFVGLRAMSVEDARAFFYPTGGIFASERARAYSPGNLEGGMRSLRMRLAQLGHPQAKVFLDGSPQISPSGEVAVRIAVVEGARYVWSAAIVAGEAQDVSTSTEGTPLRGSVFNEESMQDWIVVERNRYLVAGYPDVRFSSTQTIDPTDNPNEMGVSITLHATPGPRVQMGEVRFEGLAHSREAFLRDYLDLDESRWFNRLELERAQFELGRLGVFQRVRSSTEEISVDRLPSRDVVFSLEERNRFEMSALGGYGSYERVRIGLQAKALNLFGLSHSGQVRLKASTRSLAGIGVYNVPRPLPWLEFGEARLQGLIREEISFKRQEALMAFGVERGFFDQAVRVNAEYRYELLRSTDFKSDDVLGDTRATVGSLLLGLSWDTRDRVISPQTGHSFNTQLELASPAFGSDSYFQRLVVLASYHFPMNQGRLRLHFGFEGGLLARLGSEASELPVNKRFFPGGENSIRGYKEGEASPLDADGNAIGAEIYTLGHLEFEAWLYDSFALVLFSDGMWASADLTDTASGETLYTMGLGLRYNTPLGPLRLEYGHNLNPRSGDPDGTVHFSIGFPF